MALVYNTKTSLVWHYCPRRRTFGLRKKEVTGSWRKQDNEELRNFHSSPNVIRVIKSGRMGCV
jgi:hypothetical protein